jgi:MYXO-CTERM domain-containing protein
MVRVIWRRKGIMSTRGVACVGAVLVCLSFSASTQATIVTMELSYEFSGAVPPEGPTPWLTATFDDENTPGSVNLLLETTNLVDAECVDEWMFNLDPVLDPTNLSFSLESFAGLFVFPVISTGVNAYMANGDGFFDIQFKFNTGDGSDDRFGVGDSVEYQITGRPTLTAQSFRYVSYEDGGQGEYYSAAHVRSIGPDDDGSGWIAVPEPAALTLLALGGLLVGGRRRP